jgi:hypothetical protein
MAEQVVSIETMARPLIEQCRREIAAAWVQVEAAREVLKRNRWLIGRWSEHGRLDEANESVRLSSFDRSEAARIGMFVGIEPEGRRRVRRKRSDRSPAPLKRSAQHASKTRLKPDRTLDFVRARG